ncbi:GTP cyclohydrolase II [Azospirillum fermentarium]|uniref:GTP cyclohydrolase II n=1 Tax=Azospirillum fermentarium TaxID=1233114 RepID=UPI002227639A|nr:GTP cyclohydrolase II [Azospirillum fermentarium]MCW2244999.1 GTP cyclohydrolase II [Azospirillum fermentarium]
MPAEPLTSAALPLDDAVLRAVDRALAALRRGEPVAILSDDGKPAVALGMESVTPDSVAALTALAGGGVPVLAVTRRRALVLGLPAADSGAVVLSQNGGIAVDTALALADPEMLNGPGLPPGLSATPAPVGCAAAAAVDLAKLARLLPAAVLVPVALTGGTAAEWSARHDVLTVTARDVEDYRVHVVRSLRRVADARVPLDGAEETRVVAFRPADGGPEYLAIVIGEPDPDQPVLARLHSECFTGDLLGSLRCDCGEQLRGAIREISNVGSGVLLYLAQEGRGIGLVNKLRAYRLQDSGFDTVDANELLGFEADERVYLPAAEMLRQLGYGRVRLMTNNPEKLRQLARCGIEVVERVPHIFASNGHNAAYLRTKAERSGHMF